MQGQASGNVALANIAEFSIAAIAAIDLYGPKVDAAHIIIPNGGLQVTVQWDFAGTLLAIIPFVQLVLILVVLFMGHQVIVREDSPFANAVLFKPLLDHVHGGAMLKSKALIEMREADEKLVYGFDEYAEEEGVAMLKAKRVPVDEPYRPIRFKDGMYM